MYNQQLVRTDDSVGDNGCLLAVTKGKRDLKPDRIDSERLLKERVYRIATVIPNASQIGQ